MMKKKELISILFGIIFFLAALYRIFNYNEGVEEFSRLNLPLFLLPFTIILELILSIMFFLRKKIIYASLIAIAFLFTAVALALILNFNSIMENIKEIFIFNANPTDILLHIMYMLLLVVLFLEYNKKEVRTNHG